MRLEDWMSYLIYEKTKKTDLAKSTLEKINKVKNNNPQPIQLVTAWVMEKQDKKNEAIQWLDQLIQKYPENKMLLWVKAKFLNQPANNLSINEKNATVRVTGTVQANCINMKKLLNYCFLLLTSEWPTPRPN